MTTAVRSTARLFRPLLRPRNGPFQTYHAPFASRDTGIDPTYDHLTQPPHPFALTLRRWKSNTNNTATPDIPDPTWSVANLRLTHDPSDPNDSVSEKELYDLAYRCLIDVRTLPQKDRDVLRKDLAGIMRCVSVVSDASQKISESAGDMGPEELYDAFRGPYKDGAPLRDDSDTSVRDDWTGKDEAERILESAVSSGKDRVKVTDDGEAYFSVATGRGDADGGVRK